MLGVPSTQLQLYIRIQLIELKIKYAKLTKMGILVENMRENGREKVGESYSWMVGVMIFVFESLEAKYLLIRRWLETFSAGIHDVNLSAHKILKAEGAESKPAWSRSFRARRTSPGGIAKSGPAFFSSCIGTSRW